MKKLSFLVLFISATHLLSAQNGGFYVKLSPGYIPSQEVYASSGASVKGKAITFDISGGWFQPPGYDGYSGFEMIGGLGGGVSIRNYRGIPNDWMVGTDDPRKESVTRWDIHIEPILGVGSNAISLVVYPQFGLWYAGSENAAVKFLGTIALNADLIVARFASIGVTYRATRFRIAMNNYASGNMIEGRIFIEPALEFRIGLFVLGQSD